MSILGNTVGAVVPVEDIEKIKEGLLDIETLNAMLETGYLKLSPKQCGPVFPSDAPDGTLFFLEVTE